MSLAVLIISAVGVSLLMLRSIAPHSPRHPRASVECDAPPAAATMLAEVGSVHATVSPDGGAGALSRSTRGPSGATQRQRDRHPKREAMHEQQPFQASDLIVAAAEFPHRSARAVRGSPSGRALRVVLWTVPAAGAVWFAVEFVIGLVTG